MDKVLVRNALQGMIRATDDDSTPIIRRLARIQARAALENLDAEAASGAGERVEAPGDRWPDDWKRYGFNGAIRQAQAALRYLAKHDRPIGGEQFPNAGCCTQIADELETTRKRYEAFASLPPATDPAMVADAADWMEEARKAAAATRPRSPWAKAVMRGDRDDSDEVRAAMFAIDATRAALAAAPTIPATGEAVPLRVDWNKHDLAEAYDLVEGVRSKMAQSPESPLDTSLRAALDAIEAADCEWDGLTKATIPATGHAATEKTLSDVLDEARISLRVTDACLECNADDVQRWHDTIAWLESLA